MVPRQQWSLFAVSTAAAAAAIWLLRRRRAAPATTKHAITSNGRKCREAREAREQRECTEGLADLREVTALHSAVQQGQLHRVIELLQQAGASCINALGAGGATALHHAAARWPPTVRLGATTSAPELPSSAMVAVLVQHGADVNTRDALGDAPLHVAAWLGNLCVMRLLVESNAQVDVPGHRDESPLATVALRAHTDSARCLLELRASVHVVDQRGKGPLQAAAASGELAMVTLLEEHGASDPEARQTVQAQTGSPRGGAGLDARGSLEEELEQLARGHSEAWAAKMRQFSPLAQRLLVMGADPATVSPTALLREIVNRRPVLYPLSKFRAAQAALTESAESALLHVPAALSLATCAMMRGAIVRQIESSGRPERGVFHCHAARPR